MHSGALPSAEPGIFRACLFIIRHLYPGDLLYFISFRSFYHPTKYNSFVVCVFHSSPALATWKIPSPLQMYIREYPPPQPPQNSFSRKDKWFSRLPLFKSFNPKYHIPRIKIFGFLIKEHVIVVKELFRKPCPSCIGSLYLVANVVYQLPARVK